ncbi:P-loop containing nucleoside triphosphate hydrolase protein [Boletus edulis BED1]|uniref:P-loop containing nucleoside triphosphate hydrolase protein n=1 Tax=Boletus edulis BED1 TaxID=1328754 RepID=A0AAD4BV35_BOLED|nr:P-loop containing nucleoside triphosphate hydrolase protein [Boletus edulis BED1]
MVHGPPGTGKTTVIAASVVSHCHANSGQAIWVTAQSNVAVKNIAEKFIKLLVSKDFHFDWHEHLYEKLEPCFIRSDVFPKSIVEAERLLLDCKVILCTLSMFSNPQIKEIMRIVPVETIILDEASQIECGNYLPIFYHFHSTLSKLVFIGDDKQLPPYGQEEIPELRSVFEFSHLRRRASFLDTQCLLSTLTPPTCVNENFVLATPPRPSKACRFIDVNNGRETKAGPSWINKEEARVVVKVARLYESSGMSFRIITPYDAQRAHIESLLER